MMRILLVALLMTGGYAAGYIAADLQWQADTLKTKLDESEASRDEERGPVFPVVAWDAGGPAGRWRFGHQL
ncbi:hypothetical protein [Pantoea agglomerans]|uniref:hypothetical protein n=1 Tax=Enterobacter agglomerans TaxID=549 RepID=UPI003C7DEA5A